MGIHTYTTTIAEREQKFIEQTLHLPTEHKNAILHNLRLILRSINISQTPTCIGWFELGAKHVFNDVISYYTEQIQFRNFTKKNLPLPPMSLFARGTIIKNLTDTEVDRRVRLSCEHWDEDEVPPSPLSFAVATHKDGKNYAFIKSYIKMRTDSIRRLPTLEAYVNGAKEGMVAIHGYYELNGILTDPVLSNSGYLSMITPPTSFNAELELKCLRRQRHHKKRSEYASISKTRGEFGTASNNR